MFLFDCNKVVSAMSCPMILQVDRSRKIMTCSCKPHKKFHICSIAHFPPSNASPGPGGAHGERIFWYAEGATWGLPATSTAFVAHSSNTCTRTNRGRHSWEINICSIHKDVRILLLPFGFRDDWSLYFPRTARSFSLLCPEKLRTNSIRGTYRRFRFLDFHGLSSRINIVYRLISWGSSKMHPKTKPTWKST